MLAPELSQPGQPLLVGSRRRLIDGPTGGRGHVPVVDPLTKVACLGIEVLQQPALPGRREWLSPPGQPAVEGGGVVLIIIDVLVVGEVVVLTRREWLLPPSHLVPRPALALTVLECGARDLSAHAFDGIRLRPRCPRLGSRECVSVAST